MDLSVEQGELADVLANLTAAADSEEEDLEKLPEMELDADDTIEDGLPLDLDGQTDLDSNESTSPPNEDANEDGDPP